MTIHADPLRAAGSDIAALSDALRRGGSALESVPAQVVDVVRSQKWAHFVTRTGNEIRPPKFEEFVAQPPLAGLGTTIQMLRKICRDSKPALDAIDDALGSRQGERTDLLDIVQEVRAPTGNRVDRALRKLRKDAPELHAQVLAGEVTAHAAMVKAGFRPHTFTVRPEPTSAARTLRKHMTPEQCAELARLLAEQ